jgi:hypothetical protein
MAEAPIVHVGDELFDPARQKIGKITDVIVDDRTLQPQWYVVRVGMLKGNHLVPVGSVSLSDKGVAVPYDKGLVQCAPKPEGPTPTEAELDALCAHYGVKGGG